MMHGSEWTLKYDEPKVETVAREWSQIAIFATSGSSYFNVHSLSCIICIMFVFYDWPFPHM